MPSSCLGSSFRRSGVVGALLLLAVPVVAGCGDDGTITKVGDPDVAATSTTTTAAAETTTTASDETPDDDAGDDVTVDETSTDDSWSASPGEFRGRDGLRVAYTCPPGGEAYTVWGTGPFTDDSSVCTAAVYAGEIGFADGGRVVIEIGPGLDAYASGSANEVTTEDYGTWAGSFDVVG